MKKYRPNLNQELSLTKNKKIIRLKADTNNISERSKAHSPPIHWREHPNQRRKFLNPRLAEAYLQDFAPEAKDKTNHERSEYQHKTKQTQHEKISP